MPWSLEYWKPSDSNTSPVKKELEKEIKGNSQAKINFYTMVTTLENLGPHDFISPKNKSLGGGLFELRDTSNGKRYYYCETNIKSANEKLVLLLGAVGSKNNASEQNRDIKLARERLASINEQNILLEGN